MKFTEYEMTVAVDAVGKMLYAATRPPWRRDVDSAWAELKRVDKYHHQTAAGDMILAALIDLPERPTIGATPQFTEDEYTEAGVASARSMAEAKNPGSWESMSQKKQDRLARACGSMAKVGVEAMPHRQDPDALVVPDHL